MVVVATAATSRVFTTDVLVDAPAATLTVGVATVAVVVLLLVSVTVIDAGAAAHSRATVPVTALGPTTGFGVRDILATPIGRTFRVTVLLIPA